MNDNKAFALQADYFNVDEEIHRTPYHDVCDTLEEAHEIINAWQKGKEPFTEVNIWEKAKNWIIPTHGFNFMEQVIVENEEADEEDGFEDGTGYDCL